MIAVVSRSSMLPDTPFHAPLACYCVSSILKQTLMVLESMPPLDEVTRYNQAAANGPDGLGGGGGQGGLSSLIAALPTDTALPKAKFNKGDKVRG